MKKDISPEMYNYNKFPGPDFVHFDHYVKSDGITFELIANEKDAFNTTSFGQRFTEILLKYDYIVGDWGNEQLRLKGFYKDHNDVKKTSRISRLEDYIKEFCNFGCAYFVLENENPQLITFEEERLPRRKKSTKNTRRKPQNAKQRPAKEQGTSKPKPIKASKEKTNDKVIFTSKKRKDTSKVKARSKSSQTAKSQSQTKSDHFIIRKKDNNS